MGMIKYLEFNFDNNCVTFKEDSDFWFDLNEKELKEYINDINVELQAYKDKEDNKIILEKKE